MKNIISLFSFVTVFFSNISCMEQPVRVLKPYNPHVQVSSAYFPKVSIARIKNETDKNLMIVFGKKPMLSIPAHSTKSNIHLNIPLQIKPKISADIISNFVSKGSEESETGNSHAIRVINWGTSEDLGSLSFARTVKKITPSNYEYNVHFDLFPFLSDFEKSELEELKASGSMYEKLRYGYIYFNLDHVAQNENYQIDIIFKGYNLSDSEIDIIASYK